MATEIERKFLVKKESWKAIPKMHSVSVKQGYLSAEISPTVRVRLAGEKAFLTLKGKNSGISRAEFEYEIPVKDAEELLAAFSKNTIEKTRYLVQHEGKNWEVDEFHGANEGLIVAEIELESEDEKFALPEWIAEEVSGDARYYNSNLVTHPYSKW